LKLQNQERAWNEIMIGVFEKKKNLNKVMQHTEKMQVNLNKSLAMPAIDQKREQSLPKQSLKHSVLLSEQSPEIQKEIKPSIEKRHVRFPSQSIQSEKLQIQSPTAMTNRSPPKFENQKIATSALPSLTRHIRNHSFNQTVDETTHRRVLQSTACSIKPLKQILRDAQKRKFLSMEERFKQVLPSAAALNRRRAHASLFNGTTGIANSFL